MATDKGNRDIIDLLSRQTAVSNPNVSYRKGRGGGGGGHFRCLDKRGGVGGEGGVGGWGGEGGGGAISMFVHHRSSLKII